MARLKLGLRAAAALLLLCLAALCVTVPALDGPGAVDGGPQAAAGSRGTPYDVQLPLGEFFFNPSVVKHRGVYLATARTAHMKRIDKTNWWFNDAFVCMSAEPTFSSTSCRKFDPWQGRFQECLWGTERKVAEVDTTGFEDPKLFVWPGKGVYAVVGRKPEALGASPHCRDPIYVQFIVQVVSDDTSDEWTIHRPRELKLGPFAPAIYSELKGKGHPIKEKNWMPFIHQGHLFMTHSVMPHRVLRMSSNGFAAQLFLTHNSRLLAPFAGQDVHGGPPVVLIDGELLLEGAEPYYLGVLHFFETYGHGKAKVKHYHHYAYKTEARPPFRICAVSEEMALVTRNKGDAPPNRDWTHQRIWKDTSKTAYASGLFLDGDRILLSYGSSDIDARLLAWSMDDMEALFKEPFDCSGAEVMDAGSGEPMPPPSAGVPSGGVVLNGTSSEGGGGTREYKKHRRRKRHFRRRARERAV